MMENVEQEILSILWANIRLVARPDFDETETWMVKPGCLEKCARLIAEKYPR